MCVCVCVRERERERERGNGSSRKSQFIHVSDNAFDPLFWLFNLANVKITSQVHY